MTKIEPPPGDLEAWLPQRTRWLKGFMQTFGVHSRTVSGLGARGVLSLIMTIGAPILAAAAHAVSLAWLIAVVAVAVAAGRAPAMPMFALSVLVTGAVSAWLTLLGGARRAGLRYCVIDMLSAPAYWSLLTLAFGHALWRLIDEPFAWDKTRHHPDAVEVAPTPTVVAVAGRKAA